MSENRADPKYISSGIYREETLYYDLGYRFARLLGRKPKKALDLDLTKYLFITSIILHGVTAVSQIFTLIVIALFYVFNTVLNKEANKNTSINFLILLFIANIIDHFVSGVTVRPGVILDANLNLLTWILEIIWVVIFTIQIMLILQPTTPIILKGGSVQPSSANAYKNYKALEKRLENTEYAIEELDTVINLELIKESLIGLSKIIAIIVSVALILDIFIWRIVSTFGEGDNIQEEYYISGLVFILFSLLLIYTGLFYPDDKTTATTAEN